MSYIINFFFAFIIISITSCQNENQEYLDNSLYFQQLKNEQNKGLFSSSDDSNDEYEIFDNQDFTPQSSYQNTNQVYSKAKQQTPYKHKIIDTPLMHKNTMRKYKVLGKWYYPKAVPINTEFRGIASWYGPNFNGKRTSNGEVYDMYSVTAAHKTLPMNTMVKVTNLENNKQSIIRINDRGPFVDNRILDLSYAAAKKLGIYENGTARVIVKVLGFNAQHGYNTLSNNQFEDKYLKNIQLQIGVFSNKQKAQNIGKKYEDTIHKSYIKTQNKNNKILYKTILRNFKTLDEVNKFKKDMNLNDSFIIGD